MTAERTRDTPVEVRLWCVPEPESPDVELAQRYQSLLSADEHQRWQRFSRAADQQRFLTTRALLRTVLGEYCGVAPQALCFSANAWGKPALVAAAGGLAVPHFNLSHTRGMALLAVSWDAELGVDVESSARNVEAEALTARFFAAEELRVYRALPAGARQAYFLQLWTLKEAYVKALGLGLRIPLDSFIFDLTGGQIRYRLQATDSETPLLQFRSITLASGFQVALAASCRQPLALQWRSGLPLLDFAPLTV